MWVCVQLSLGCCLSGCCLYGQFHSIRALMQADKGDQSGFDIILEKHLNGKNVMKDMIDFFRER